MRKWIQFSAFAAVTALCAGRASATYHLFRINEIYSNPSGSIQFIEFREDFGANGQEFVSEAPDVRSLTNDFIFPTNLPNANTANKSFLLGTSAYAAIAGALAPDYVIPANFFNPAGDTLQYGSTGPDGVVDLTSFGPLPADPTESLNRVGTSGNNYIIATDSPTDFAGVTGTVPEPGSAMLLTVGMVLLSTRRIRRQFAADQLPATWRARSHRMIRDALTQTPRQSDCRHGCLDYR